jgi:hypothetical protein
VVVFSISNPDSNSNKVGEEMDLETIIPHNHLYPVLIPHEPMGVPFLAIFKSI